MEELQQDLVWAKLQGNDYEIARLEVAIMLAKYAPRNPAQEAANLNKFKDALAKKMRVAL